MGYPTLEKVPYKDDNEYAKRAREFRRAMFLIGRNIGGRNVATIALHYPPPIGIQDAITLPSEPPAKGKAFAQHSEKVLIHAVVESLNRGAKILWMYTERQPCGNALGHANCDAFLTKMMTKYGVSGTSTKVYYSFDYPTKEDLRSEIGNNMLTEEEATLLAREWCLMGTTELMEAARQIGLE
jgi:Xanthomonas XOO_2897-like deaminase